MAHAKPATVTLFHYGWRRCYKEKTIRSPLGRSLLYQADNSGSEPGFEQLLEQGARFSGPVFQPGLRLMVSGP
jgi:hypothetical protein